MAKLMRRRSTITILLIGIASVEDILKVSRKALRCFARKINDLRDIHGIQITFL